MIEPLLLVEQFSTPETTYAFELRNAPSNRLKLKSAKHGYYCAASLRNVVHVQRLPMANFRVLRSLTFYASTSRPAESTYKCT